MNAPTKPYGVSEQVYQEALRVLDTVDMLTPNYLARRLERSNQVAQRILHGLKEQGYVERLALGVYRKKKGRDRG